MNSTTTSTILVAEPPGGLDPSVLKVVSWIIFFSGIVYLMK
jgi:hypothetical protein